MARCPHCRKTYKPARMGQKSCLEMDCILKAGQARKAKEAAKQAKVERREIRARKEKLKTRGDYYKDAAKAIRDYIRARDEGKECISCSTILIKRGAPGGDYDCGHYRGTGRAKHLELVEMNQNGQCKHCNRDQRGAYHEQRPKMIERYGLAAVEALDADQEPRKHSIPDLIEIRATYRAKLKELRQNDAAP